MMRRICALKALLLYFTICHACGVFAETVAVDEEWVSFPSLKSVSRKFVIDYYQSQHEKFNADSSGQAYLLERKEYTHATLDAGYIGQEQVMQSVKSMLKHRTYGLVRDTATCIVLAGPSGVGKTELAHRIGSAILGKATDVMQHERSFITFDMTAYTGAESVQSFTGSPPGYEGKSPMKEVLMQHPNAVILLDEFEKGYCKGIPPLLLKMLDRNGRLTDKKHPEEVIPTTNATFILVTNFAHEKVTDAWKINDALSMEEAKDIVWSEMITRKCDTMSGENNPFQPALRNRITKDSLFVLTDFTARQKQDAVEARLHGLRKRYAYIADLYWTRCALAAIVKSATSHHFENESGLRGVLGKVDRLVELALTNADHGPSVLESLALQRCLGHDSNRTIILYESPRRNLKSEVQAYQIWKRSDVRNVSTEALENCNDESMSHVSSAAHPLTHIPQAPGGATTEVGSSHPKKKRGQSKSQQMEMAKDMDTSAALKRMEERLSVHDKKFEAHDLALDELKSRVAQLEFLTKLLWIAMAAMVLLSVVSTLSSVFVTVQFGLKALSYLFMPLVLTFLAALACMSYLGFDVWAIAKQVIDWNIWFFSGEGMIYGAALIFLCVAGILWLGSRTAPNKAGGGVVASNKHKYVVVSDDGARALAVALHRMGEIARDETVRDAKSSPVGDVEGDIRMVQAQTRPTKGGYKHTHISEGTAEHGEEKGTYSANKPSGVAEVGARSLQSHRSVQEMRHRDTGVARLSADAYAQRTDTHAHTAQDASTYRDTDGADYTGDGKGGS